MKKKIITITILCSSILAIAVYNQFFTEKNQLNSLLLENIEALASGEGSNQLNGPLEGPYKCAGLFNSKKYWVCKAYLVNTKCEPVDCK